MNKLNRNESEDRAVRDTSSLVHYFDTTLWPAVIRMADQNNWNRSIDVPLATNSIQSLQCSAWMRENIYDLVRWNASGKLALSLTARPIFFAIFESVMFANGLSAPQHSTYLVILEDGRDLVGGPPGVAVIHKMKSNWLRMSSKKEYICSQRIRINNDWRKKEIWWITRTNSTWWSYMNSISIRHRHFPHVRKSAGWSTSFGKCH